MLQQRVSVQAELFYWFQLPFSFSFASGPFQSGRAAANWLTPDLAENTMTETDEGRDL